MLTAALTILLLLALAVAAAHALPRTGRETQHDDPVPERYQRQAVDMDDVLRGFGADL